MSTTSKPPASSIRPKSSKTLTDLGTAELSATPLMLPLTFDVSWARLASHIATTFAPRHFLQAPQCVRPMNPNPAIATLVMSTTSS